MLIKRRERIKPGEITPRETYLNRRRFLASAGLAAGTAFASPLLMLRNADAMSKSPEPRKGTPGRRGNPLDSVVQTDYEVEGEEPTSWNDITTYNNFYEFGTSKSDPSTYADRFKPKPWSVKVTGECDKPGDYDLEDLLKPHQLEERVYRFRCVEAWSMVVPWVGVPLGPMLKRFAPTSRAKYVAFRTIFRPSEMRGQNVPLMDWPYVEALRIDEAMHPLTLMVVGLYGEVLPNQNGAPFRLMVPWKYGFKSIKSIASIRFTESQPPTSWNVMGPEEYGFYSNVNPEVDHPRWSQARERRVGDYFRTATPMFNGYAEQVASLYAGMDLKKFY